MAYGIKSTKTDEWFMGFKKSDDGYQQMWTPNKNQATPYSRAEADAQAYLLNRKEPDK